MNNKLRFLTILAVSILFSFNVVNVRALDPTDNSVCGPGEILHTNYYLFIDVNKSSDISTSIQNNNGAWTRYYGAPKYNNIHDNITPPGTLKEHGEIRITSDNGNKANTNVNYGMTWTVTQYWTYYYETALSLSQTKNPNRVYDKDPYTTYMFHKGDYKTYNNSEDNTGDFELYNAPKPSDSNMKYGLNGYLKTNYNRLATSNLVNSGTALPETHFDSERTLIDPATVSVYHPFRLSRTYRTADNVTGITLTMKDGTTSKNNVYAPAAYYAQFCIKSDGKELLYDQNYEGDAPEDMPEDQTWAGTTCTTISALQPKRPGYVFLGWNTDKNATAGDETYKPNSRYCGDTITLYAIWAKELKYDQNYEGNAPEDMPENQTWLDKQCTNISELLPKRKGYKFLGWNTDKTAHTPEMIDNTENQKYAQNAEYCGNSITLYAIWEKNEGPFTVTYDANKGTDAPAPQSGDTSNNTCVTISDKGKMNLDKNKFLGWSTKEDAAEADENYAPGTEYCGENGDLTLYAVWNANTGVSAHIIAFGLVSISSAIALIIAKKKNLFKQI